MSGPSSARLQLSTPAAHFNSGDQNGIEEIRALRVGMSLPGSFSFQQLQLLDELLVVIQLAAGLS